MPGPEFFREPFTKATVEIEKTYFQIQVWYAEKWVPAIKYAGLIEPANFEVEYQAVIQKDAWQAKYPGKKFKVVKITEELVG